MKTSVLAGSITNLTDARYFAARGVEWLGFNFDEESEDFIPPQSMKAIMDWVAGVKIAGRFGRQIHSEIETAIGLLDLDAVLLETFSDLDTAQKIRVPVIKEIVVERGASEKDLTVELENYAPHCAAFLFNFAENGICWDDLCHTKGLSAAKLKALCQRHKIILHIDITLEILKEMLPFVQPMGILLKGGAEEKTGYKSFDELDEIFEWLEDVE